MRTSAKVSFDRRRLLKAADLVCGAIDLLEASRPQPLTLKASNYGIRWLLLAPEFDESARLSAGWKASVNALVTILHGHGPLGFLTASDGYRNLRKALRLQAARRKGAYADPCADLWLLEASLLALCVRASFVEKGRASPAPTARDHRDVLWALNKLERAVGSQAISWENVSALRVESETRRRFAVKPHADRRALDRYTCLLFTQYLFVRFGGEVSPSVVRHFGALVGYKATDFDDKQVARFMERLNAGIWDSPPPGVL